MSLKNCKHSNKDVPKERQMLYILRNFTRIQNELAQAKVRIRELPEDIKQKFENADTSKFENLLDEIDNEEVV